jgi:hypothetical protein
VRSGSPATVLVPDARAVSKNGVKKLLTKISWTRLADAVARLSRCPRRREYGPGTYICQGDSPIRTMFLGHVPTS